jgi:four helix bundle protein
MKVHQLARELRGVSWEDADVIRQHPVTEQIAGQLYYSIGSIAVNIAEGYSRSSGRDRARIFEYALGSARESVEWYESVEEVISTDDFNARIKTLDEIIRMLLAIIPKERERTIRPYKKELPRPPRG